MVTGANLLAEHLMLGQSRQRLPKASSSSRAGVRGVILPWIFQRSCCVRDYERLRVHP